MSMDFVIDLDPTHRVLRLTITSALLTNELVDACYQTLLLVSSCGDLYAAIFDLSGVTGTTLSSEAVRSLASRAPAVPEGRNRVLVAKAPVIYGLARMLQLYRNFMGGQYHVVWSMEEAYNLTGARPEDFTQRLFPETMAA
jgi:hypothetical protein